jgi:glycosyltransferase involved in cell wall biosynthesis
MDSAAAQDIRPLDRQNEAVVIDAFVLVARGFGGDAWNERWRNGQLLGLNEPYAYGYRHAEDAGLRVIYSEDRPEGAVGRILRLGWRWLLGFDLVHAWRNRRAFFAADAVWTHTESQSLAAAALCLLFPWRKRPKLILQSVWLMDRWPDLGRLKKRLYRGLMARADLLSFHSPLNLDRARRVFPEKRCELILFGISTDLIREPVSRDRPSGPFRLLALGNDRHRDWPTLVSAVRGLTGVELRIVSSACPPQLLEDAQNIRIVRPVSNAELLDLYAWTDAVVVPLVDNCHASGTTVLQEAVLMGKPVVVSDAGGLRAYFDNDSVVYVPPQDAAALQGAIMALAEEPDAARQRACTAQAHMRNAGISARDFALRHAVWTRELLGRA